MKAFAYNAFKKTAEAIMPAPTQSHFKDKKTLTPDEFVLAGDYLVHSCPTWSWEGGDASKRWPFLPPDKQYLITRNVPCLRRAHDIETYSQTLDPKTAGEDVEGGDWVATSSAAAVDAELDAFEVLPATSTGAGAGAAAPTIPDLDADDSGIPAGLGDTSTIPDISTLDLDAPDDENEKYKDTTATAAGDVATSVVAPPSGVLQTRTYDVLISYDKYYQVPRVWLIGYGEDKEPLNQDQVMEDVHADYSAATGARKTVTVEDHPHRVAGGHVVSIHPCRHAETMRALSEGMVAEAGAEGGGDGAGAPGEFKVEHYMILFIKFIAFVVPTIEYDYTMSAGL